MIFEKVRDLLAEEMDVEASEITLETNIVDDLGADSLDIVELITTLEDEYGIVIADDEAKNLVTVGEVVAFIEKQLDK